ncbi:MAG: glycosyltransferase family 39 protein [Candidatus Aureabacteria bacterium]|nr:glycosyltransferase family 39 protein [Candidatus Auribacterota bacterium]
MTDKLLKTLVNIDDLGPILVKFSLWAVLVLGVFFLFYTANFRGLDTEDSMECAQIARNIASGRGFATDFITPLSLSYYNRLKGPGSALPENFPDLSNPPLYPLWLSLVFSFLTPSMTFSGYAVHADKIVSLLGSGIFFMATAVLVYFLAKKMFDKRTAHLSLLLYIVCLNQLKVAISGDSLAMLAFVTTAFLYSLYATDEKSVIPVIFSGVLAGLCFLCRYSFGIFIFPVLLYYAVSFKQKRAVFSLVFISGFIITALPWLIRNAVVAGNPFFSLGTYNLFAYTAVFPAHEYMRSFSPEALTKAVSLSDILGKTAAGLKSGYISLINLSDNFLICFIVAAVFYSFADKKINRFRFLVYSLFVLVILLAAAFFPSGNNLSVFVPFFVIISAGFFMKALCDFGKTSMLKSWAAVILMVAVFILPPFLFSVTRKNRALPYYIFNDKKTGLVNAVTEAMEKIPEGALIVSDVPWAVAWYGKAESIWLPWDIGEFRNVSEKGYNMEYAFFSSMLLSYPNMPEWRNIMMGRIPVETGFKYGKAVSENPLNVILSRSPLKEDEK